MDNKTTDLINKARTVSEGIGNRDVILATKYMNTQNFKNHSPMAYDGVKGIEGFIRHLSHEKSPLKTVRAFQDGHYVFTHSEGNIFGEKVFFDIYRFEDEQIVEHWDNVTEATPPNQSGHTMTDGPTEATNLEDTDENKALIKEFYEAIFLHSQFDKMPQYFDGDAFIRHDARGGDGLSALGAMMHDLAEQGMSMDVSTIHLILGQGNFVLVGATGAMGGKDVAYYDLFRVENGKIAEHWDVIENIPPQDQWNNKNGKF